jgi:predicted GIY-YIG superfamily endonuclease
MVYVANTAPRDAPCSVYLVYDPHGALLYVGVTSRGKERIREHLHQSRWGKEMCRVTWEHFPTRPLAFARERELIQSLNPWHNHIRYTWSSDV